MGEYTVAAVMAPVAVVALELAVLRSGIFRDRRYWAAIAITMAFQLPVDGWLTARETPVVSYSPHATSGIRALWNIPIEDFGFGFALVTLTLAVWQWHRRRQWHQRTSRQRVGTSDHA